LDKLGDHRQIIQFHLLSTSWAPIDMIVKCQNKLEQGKEKQQKAGFVKVLESLMAKSVSKFEASSSKSVVKLNQDWVKQ